MRTDEFRYDLPEERIAQTPAEPRDSSRLMVYDRASDRVRDETFRDLPDFLRAGDVLVLNRSRVLPARLHGTKRGRNLAVEFLLLRRLAYDRWEIIMKPGRKIRPGDIVDFRHGLSARLLEKKEDGVCEALFTWDGVFEEVLERCGEMPLPPYIHDRSAPAERYQTVYADENGSAAAPTAGLHFTPELLETLRARGVEIVTVLLHVGLGTFRPVKEASIEDHTMHREEFEISPEAAEAVNRAKREGRRVIAVGTTSVRVLESAFNGSEVIAQRNSTGIFLYPGSEASFNVTDALITNFHLPESTLLMLVAAFIADTDRTLALYVRAVREKYRFFSFGDAMLIL